MSRKELELNMGREEVSMDDISSRLSHNKVCNVTVIVQTGSWFKIPVSDGSEKKAQGRSGVIDYFYNDLDEFEWLKGEVNKAALG